MEGGRDRRGTENQTEIKPIPTENLCSIRVSSVAQTGRLQTGPGGGARRADLSRHSFLATGEALA
jgi:hypothetical protein